MQTPKALIDPLTRESFYPKRPNQIYAHRKNQVCMGNMRAREKRLAKKFIDLPMDKNRNVLKNVLGNFSQITKSKDFLLGAGFDFSFYTHCKVIDKVNNKIQYYVYEYGLTFCGEKQYKIFKND